MRLRNKGNEEVTYIETESAGTAISPFFTQAQYVWPFDKNCTQKIFFHAGYNNLLSVSSTCRLFHVNAIELATRALMNDYKIDCNSNPSCMPVPLLARVKSYYNAFENPVENHHYKSGFRSIIDPSYIVSPQQALLSICVQKDSDLCIVASFAQKADVTSKTSDIEIYQFVAGVDSKGHAYINRITETELKALISGILQDTHRNMAFKPCFASEFNSCATYLLSVIQEQKITSFKELIENLPWGHNDLRDIILGLVTNHLSMANKDSSRQIL